MLTGNTMCRLHFQEEVAAGILAHNKLDHHVRREREMVTFDVEQE